MATPDYRHSRGNRLEEQAQVMKRSVENSELDVDTLFAIAVSDCQVEIDSEEALNLRKAIELSLGQNGSNGDAHKRFRKSLDKKYEDGFIGSTYNRFCGGGIKLEDLIEKEGLKKVACCGFQVDFEWLFRHLPKDISLCIIRHWSPDLGDKEGTYQLNPKTVVVHPPRPSSKYSSMHAKFLFLFYDSFIRVIISTANLVDFDWDLIQNMLYCQDFATTEIPVSCSFKVTFVDFLQVLKVPESVVRALDKYDFSTSKVHLVTSVPGKHAANDTNYGHIGLSKVVAKNIHDCDIWDVECMSSSLGFLSMDWLNEIGNSITGKQNLQPENSSKKINRFFKVLFPSQDSVGNSLLGTEGAGSFFLSKKAFHTATFPKKNLYDYVSKPCKGLLNHLKIIRAEIVQCKEAGETVNGFYYMGSHNLTSAAWGRLISQKKVLSISNYELGVIKFCKSKEDMGISNILYSRPVVHYGTAKLPYFSRDI